ncbi:carbon storage regulator [Salisediminibacterium beveridgei]|uniref:carbon storage regulator n=1 Tax=Salisediminibacterium beveridgei TaxID=632773 RepID=UPI000A0689C4|nr:carbon storage regulator [Salisediminibacterium beveridgei]
MLVLQTKPGEEIRIGESIVIRVVENRKGQLRLAIDAPREVKIDRGERIQAAVQDVS